MPFIKKVSKNDSNANRFFFHISADLASITTAKKSKNSEKTALKQFTEKSEQT